MEELPASAAVLEDLLRYNGFHYRGEDGQFHLVFTDRGCKWETTFLCLEGAVLIYGRYPFPAADTVQAQGLCQEINRQVLYGSMFLAEGHLVFRTCADLYDPYSAYEQLGRALEYNAGVMIRFWRAACGCAAAKQEGSGDGPASQ